MGQRFGVPIPSEGFGPFMNLPREAIESLWLSYNLIGEGWALQVEDFQVIVSNASYLTEKLGITNDHVNKLFGDLDTDNNGLVDALELMSTLALISGMDTIEKLHFVFSIFDFSAKGELNAEATTLLLRSVVNGLNKVAVFRDIPSQADVDTAAALLFNSGKSLGILKISEYQKYCTSELIFTSWMKCYSSVEPPKSYSGLTDMDIDNLLVAPEYCPPVSAASSKPAVSEVTASAATRPWFTQADKCKPDELPPARSDAPEDKLDLYWVHGYGVSAADGSRNNVKYSSNGSVLYYSSNVGINLFKTEEGLAQKHMTFHKAPIACLSVNKAQNLIATADTSATSTSTINICDSNDFSLKKSILVQKFAGIRSLDFSSDSTLIIATVSDDAGSVGVYNISTGALVFEMSMGEKVVDFIFLGSNSIIAAALSTGVDFLIDENTGYMSLTSPPIFVRRSGLFQTVGKDAAGVPTTALSKFEKPDECLSGNVKGQLLFWHGKNCVQLIEAHTGSISSINYNIIAGVVASGGLDGVINLYSVSTGSEGSSAAAGGSSAKELPVVSSNYQFSAKSGPKLVTERQLLIVARIDLMAAGSIAPAVRSASLWNDGTKVLVSTKSGEIYELACATSGTPPPEASVDSEGNPVPVEIDPDAPPYVKVGDDINKGPLVTSHWSGQSPKSSVLCVAKIPGGFLTGGSDCTLRQWSCGEGLPNKCVKQINFDAGVTVITASASSIAVGFGVSGLESRWNTAQILTLAEFTVTSEVKDPSSSVLDLKFSPDGNMLAVASNDSSIYIYNVVTVSTPAANEGDPPIDVTSWVLKGKLSGHVSGVRNIDFSADGNFLRSLEVNEFLTIWDVVANFGSVLDVVTDAEGNRTDPLKSMSWASSSFPSSWDTKGIWSHLPSSMQLSCYDRNGALGVASSNSHSSQGSLSLCRVAALGRSNMSFIPAHVGSVSGVCFIEEGTRLVTTGTDDGTVKVWRVVYDSEELEVEAPIEEEAPVDPDAPAPDPLDYDSADDEDLVDREQICSMIGTKKRYFLSNNSIGDSISVSISAGLESQSIVGSVDEGAPDAPVDAPTDAPTDAPADAPAAESNVIVAPVQIADLLAMDSTASSVIADVADLPLETISRWTSQFNLSSENFEALPATSLPADELEMTWIYGYSSRLTRNSVKYSSDGRIIYPAATIAITLDKMNSTQSYYTDHDDAITALEYNAAADVFATAQRSGNGDVFVYVWTSVSGVATTLQRINCGLTNAVSALAFNSDGSLLAVACMDNSHTLIVFDWRSGVQRGSISIGNKKSLCLAFNTDKLSSGFRMIEGGVSHFTLLESKSVDLISSKNGIYGNPKKLNVLCAIALPLPTEGGNEFLLGMSNGTIGVIVRGDRKISNFASVNMTAVTSMFVVKTKDATPEEPPAYKVVVGGDKGSLKILDQDLAPLAEYDIFKSMPSLSSLGRARGIKSVCVDKLNRKILFGTAGGEIGELDIGNGLDMNSGPLVTSHCKDQTYAMDVHPIRQECITGGDDKTLRVWNLETKSMIAMIDLPDIVRTVSFSPNGQLVVAGLGGSTRRNGEWETRVNSSDAKNPKVRTLTILSYLQGQLRVVFEANEATDAITCTLFSPDQKRLYVGSRDKNVYVYDPLNDFQCIEVFEGHKEAVRSFDLSTDITTLISQGEGSEVLVWDLMTSKQLRDGKREKAMKTFNANFRRNTFGPDSVGVFSVISSFDEVRSLSKSVDSTLLCTGNSNGSLKLFSYPSPRPSAAYKEYCGHTQEGIAGTLFTFEDQYIMSMGRDDRTLIQWKVLKNSSRIAPASFKFSSLSDASVELNIGRQVSLKPFRTLGVSVQSGVPQAVYCGADNISIIGGSFPLLMDSAKQQKSLSIGSVFKPVTSQCVSLDGKLIMFGEGMPKSDVVSRETYCGSLMIVNTLTSKLVCTLNPRPTVSGIVEKDGFIGGVTSMTFSEDAKFVACIAGDIYNSLHVFHSANGQWSDGVNIFSGAVDTLPVDLVCFMPQQSDFQIVTSGKGAGGAPIKFWKLNGKNASFFNAIPNESIGIITSMCAVSANTICTGDSEGKIGFWSSNQLVDICWFSHSSAVTALISIKDPENNIESIILSASSDKIYKIYKTTIQIQSVIEVSDILGKIGRSYPSYGVPFVTSIACDKSADRILATLSTNVIVEISVNSLATSIIQEGNVGNRPGSSKIVAHPTEDFTLLSISKDDSVLKIWDLFYSPCMNTEWIAPTLVEVLPTPHPPTAVCFDRTGAVLILGLSSSDNNGKSGKIMVLSYDLGRRERRYNSELWKTGSSRFDNLQNIASKEDNAIVQVNNSIHNVGTGHIDLIRFSPDAEQKYLFVSTEDKKIFFYDNLNELNPLGVLDCKMYVESYLKGQSTLLFDFSMSATQLRVCGGLNEESMTLQYFDLTKPDTEMNRPATNITNGMESAWATTSSMRLTTFSYIRDSYFNAEASKIVTSSDSKKTLISYSDGSFLLSDGSTSEIYYGHAPGDGPDVTFLAEGKYLASASSVDGTIIVWKIY